MEQTFNGSTLHIEDLSKLAGKYLTEESIAALEKKSHSQVFIDNSGTYTCIYLSVLVNKSNIQKGVGHICKAVNTLSAEKLIHSTLAVPSSIDLAVMPNQSPSSAVFCFVLVPAKLKEYAEKIVDCATESGEMGPRLDNPEIERREGEFTSLIRISHTSAAFDSVEDIVKRRTQELLNVLPKGTEVVSTTQCAIMDLSLPVLVTFYNPLMKDYKEVELEYCRHAAIVNDKVEQFNLLTSVKYTRR